MMKKEYIKPTAEKINFDYVESVVACPSGCADQSHSWHAGAVYQSCNGSNNNNNNNNNNNTNAQANATVTGSGCWWNGNWGAPCN